MLFRSSLSGSPHTTGAWFECSREENLNSLEGMPTKVYGWIELPYRSDLGLLRLCLVEGASRIRLYKKDPDHRDLAVLRNIVNRYKGTGKGALSAFATELIKAGYRGNAKL